MLAERKRPRWLFALTLSVLGIGLLVWARFDHNDYWRALMLHFGTAIALFALLALLEPYLTRRIEVALRPHTLEEAQMVTRAKLNARNSRGALSDPAANIDLSIRWIGEQLSKSGLQEMPMRLEQDGSYSLVFQDGAEDPIITWTVSRHPQWVLRHHIAIRGSKPQVWERRLGHDLDGKRDMASLQEFETAVTTYLIDIGRRLS